MAASMAVWTFRMRDTRRAEEGLALLHEFKAIGESNGLRVRIWQGYAGGGPAPAQTVSVAFEGEDLGGLATSIQKASAAPEMGIFAQKAFTPDSPLEYLETAIANEVYR